MAHTHSSWRRRALQACAAAGAALLLASCGGGTIENKLVPKRFIVFGAAMADVGNNNTRYTVNDGSVNTWVEKAAIDYDKNLTILPSSQGGTGYARGNARIVAKPDAAGNSATPTVKEQIDAFLGAGGKIADNDVVVVNGGISDIVFQMQAVLAGTQTEDQMIANLQQAGRDMGAQVRRLVQAGGTHVLVVGPYNLGLSIWAAQIARGDTLTNASLRFNEALLLSMVDLGASVLYVDAQLFFNLLISNPGGNNLTDATTTACNSVDPGPGIGIGRNQVNSALCTPNTITSGVDYTKLVFADALYFTPVANQLFGDFVQGRMRFRW